MTPKVAVVADTAASLPRALARRWGIRVVPLHVVGETGSQPEDAVHADDVLAALEAGELMSTSQPSPAQFAAAYSAAAADGARHIVSVHMSSKLSGTVDSARAAAAEASVPVTVIDSQTLAMAQGFAALAGAVAAVRGDAPEEVAAAVTRTAAGSRCFFTVDSLEYLRRSGRVSGPLAAIGSALSIRPVLEMRDGEVSLVERVRTTERARRAMIGLVEGHLSEFERPGLAVMCLGGQAFADDAAVGLEQRHPDLGMVVRTPVSAVLAVHTGPGTLAGVLAELPVGA